MTLAAPITLSSKAKTSALIKKTAELVLKLKATPLWELTPPPVPGVYVIYDKRQKLIYVGESGNLQKRVSRDLHQTRNHTFRRSYGNSKLGLPAERRLKDMKSTFGREMEKRLTQKMRKLQGAFLPVYLGRSEVEEHIIESCRSTYNKKSVRQ